MLVGEWGERDGREPSALQPVHSGGVNSYGLLCCDVGAILWDRGGWGREGEEGEEGREGEGEEGGRKGKGGGGRGRRRSIKAKARFQNTWESSRRW